MNREVTSDDELRWENRRLAADVEVMRVRAEAAEAWCESWKRGAGISSRERDEARADAMEEIKAMRGEIESQERAHAEEIARYQVRLSEAHRAHGQALDKLAWLGHVHSTGSRCAACAAYDAHRAAKLSARDGDEQ